MVRKSLKTITKQGFYKSLRKLIKNEILIKSGKLYLFNYQWLENQRDYYTRLSKNQREVLLKPLIDREIERVDFNLSSLMEAADLWIQLILVLVKNNMIIYEWHPYLWFVLLKPREELRLFSFLQRKSAQIKAVVSPHSRFNKMLLEVWSHKHLTTTTRHTLFKKIYRTHYTLCGEFLISVKFSSTLEKQIINLHKDYNSLYHLRNVISTFSARGRIRITVESNISKLEKVKKMFEDTFSE